MAHNIHIPPLHQLTDSDLHLLHSYGISEYFDIKPRNRFLPENTFAKEQTKPISNHIQSPSFSAQSNTSQQKMTSSQPPRSQPETSSLLNPIAVLLEEFKKDINQCTSVDELKVALEKHNKLPICLTATQPVIGYGDTASPVVFIGEAPGEEEDIEGKPFVGKAGKLLTAILDSINIDREKIYITNTVPWRPPGNRVPTATEINFFKPFIHQLLKIIKPKIIVTLGGTATSGLCSFKSGIVSLRGKIMLCDLETLQVNPESLDISEPHTLSRIQEHTQKGKPILIPTYHPAYLIRSPGQKKQAWSDMITLKKVLHTVNFF